MKLEGFNAHTKYTILKHALKEDNVSLTCKLFGISRTTFYNWKRAYEKHGIMGLEAKEPQKPKMPNKVSKEIEREILAYVVKYPKDGPRRIYYELIAEGFDVGETGIYNVLKRNGLTRKEQRIKYSMNKELHIKTKPKDNREVPDFLSTEEAYPGYLVLQRISYIGNFEGVGKIYQYSFYDTVSQWGEIKLYNKKQDIDIWHYFEFKLVYLLKIFNLSIENLITEKERVFLPYFVKGNKCREIIEDFNINHIFITPKKDTILDDIMEFNEFLITEFYNKIGSNSDLDSFPKIEEAITKFMLEYNFNNVISSGPNIGKTPAEVILERASQNNADLDTLPLWILALINHAKRDDKDE